MITRTFFCGLNLIASLWAAILPEGYVFYILLFDVIILTLNYKPQFFRVYTILFFVSSTAVILFGGNDIIVYLASKEASYFGLGERMFVHLFFGQLLFTIMALFVIISYFKTKFRSSQKGERIYLFITIIIILVVLLIKSLVKFSLWDDLVRPLFS